MVKSVRSRLTLIKIKVAWLVPSGAVPQRALLRPSFPIIERVHTAEIGRELTVADFLFISASLR